jgi:hypothetical protein
LDADGWFAQQEVARAALKAGVSDLLAGVAQLQQLTSLHLRVNGGIHHTDMLTYNPAACSAFTSSSVLQQLRLLMPWWQQAAWSHIFPPSRQLTALTHLTLDMTGAAGTLLQQVVTCCPALRSVELLAMSAVALQLPALRRLQGLTRLLLTSCDNAAAEQLAACTQLQELTVGIVVLSQPSVDAAPMPAALNHHGLTALQRLRYLLASVAEDDQVDPPKFVLRLQVCGVLGQDTCVTCLSVHTASTAQSVDCMRRVVQHLWNVGVCTGRLPADGHIHPACCRYVSLHAVARQPYAGVASAVGALPGLHLLPAGR